MPILKLKDKDRKSDSTAYFLQQINTIGAGSANSIRVQASGIAEEHATIMFDGRDFNIKVLPGNEPVRINGKTKLKARLGHMDSIEVGPCLMELDLLAGSVA